MAVFQTAGALNTSAAPAAIRANPAAGGDGLLPEHNGDEHEAGKASRPPHVFNCASE